MLPTKEWKAEYAKLTVAGNRFNNRYASIKDEVKEAEQKGLDLYSVT